MLRGVQRRRVAASLIVLSVLSAVLLQASPAQAEISNGICTLNLRFAFTTSPTLTGPASPYTYNSLTGSSCTIDNLQQTPSVSMSGSAAAGLGGTTLSRCGVLAGLGPFNQSWGGLIPLVDHGTHVVVGTWLHATMVVTAYPESLFRMTGVVELVPADIPATLQALQRCINGQSVPEIRMTGVEVFNDPIIEGT